MASIVSTNLSHELQEARVAFTVQAKCRFEEHEQGANWLFQIEFMEEDPAVDDSLYMSRHYFVPSSEEVDLSFVEEIPKVTVNTEWGKEEVYANVRLRALDAPPNFTPADARTNTDVVDV